MVTYHTPMPIGWIEGQDEFTRTYLRRALFGALTGPLPLGEEVYTLSGGRARWTLCGGNLALVRDSLGTPWEIDTRDKILFLEDVNKDTRSLDEMFTQLRNAGKFRDCAGILLGQFKDCVQEAGGLDLAAIIEETVLPAGKPVLAGLPCGHEQHTLSLPLGATVTMDADAKTLEADA